MEKKPKRLSRTELFQLLAHASEANEALAEENDALRQELEARQQLPRSMKVGSIAEAALQANGYFDAAQQAADDYLREIKHLRDQLVEKNLAATQLQEQLQIQAHQARADVRDAREAELEALASECEQAAQHANARMQEAFASLREEQARLEDARAALSATQAQLGQTQDQLAGMQAACDDLVRQRNQLQAQLDAQAAQARESESALLSEAREKAEALLADAERRSRDIIERAERRVESMATAAYGCDDSASTGPIMRRGRHARVN